jgi:hypothetical protein
MFGFSLGFELGFYEEGKKFSEYCRFASPVLAVKFQTNFFWEQTCDGPDL